jgi:Fic family protein
MSLLQKEALELQRKYLSIKPDDWSVTEQESLINDFTFHSTSLEGMKIGYGDTIEYLKNGVVRPGTNVKDITDLENHRSLLKKIFESYDQMELSNELIRSLHAELMKDSVQWGEMNAYMGGPGEFKRENNYGMRMNGEYKEYLDWTLVGKNLQALCDETNHRLKQPDDAIPAMNKFHYEFANNIHPFGYGNGRMVRLLHNLLLLKNQLPTIIINSDEKKIYIESIIHQEKYPHLGRFNDFLTSKTIQTLKKRLDQSKGMIQ